MITIDWTTFEIFVPQSYLTVLGGGKYGLNVEVLRNDLKNIEDSEEGIVFPQTHNRNAPVVLSGVTYAQTLEVVSPYTVTFENTGTPYVVVCSGANHNLGDVTNFDGGMSLIIGNSAGLIAVNTGGGGGATAADIWNYPARSLTTASAPTAEQNAAAVLAALIEGGMTLKDILRILLAVSAGDATGLEGATMSFKSLDGTKNRVAATYSSGDRTVTTRDPS